MGNEIKVGSKVKYPAGKGYAEGTVTEVNKETGFVRVKHGRTGIETSRATHTVEAVS